MAGSLRLSLLKLELVASPNYGLTQTKNWINKKDRAAKDLREILPFVIANEQSNFARSWLNKDGRSSEDLKAVLPFVADEQSKSNIAKSWLKKDGRSSEDLIAILPFVADEQSKSNIAQSWLPKDGRSSEDLKAVLPFVADEKFKFRVVESWINKEEVRTSEDLKAVLPFVADGWSRSYIAHSWLNKDGRTSEDLKAILPLFSDDKSKSEIAYSWLNKNGRTAEDLTGALPFVIDKWSKSDIARSWLNKNDRTAEDLKVALPFVIDDQSKFDIAKSWLNKDGRTSEDLKAVLPFITNEEHKSEIAKSWLNKNEKTSEDLKAVLIFFTDDQSKSDLAKYWFEKNERSSEDLKTVLQFIVPNEQSRSNIISSWFDKEEGERTLEVLGTVLPSITDEWLRSNIATDWINKDQSPQTKYQNFTDLAKAGIFPSSDKYDVTKIATAYLNLNLSKDKFPSLCSDLYPNSEVMQLELFKEFVKKIDANSLTVVKPQLQSFIINLQGDEFTLDATTTVKNKLNLPPVEVLEITKNRLSNKYESISDLLKKKPLEESLNEEGLKSVRETFLNNNSPIDINLADLFSYYDIQEKLVEFKSLLLPEVLQEIATSFVPSSKAAYVSETEFKKMSTLFNNAETSESNLQLPSVKIVADYLNSKVGDINKVLTPEEITTYQFGNSTTLQNEEIPNRREYLTEKFRNLLTAEHPTAEEVSEFFERALNPEVANPETAITPSNGIINKENKGKLTSFFNANKHQLASLFQQEDGLDNFAGTITSLGHGCVANIATQSKIALYQSLITDPNDQALFGVFREKISGTILNSGGDLLTGSTQGISIFQDHNINKNFISPNGLLSALSEEFYCNGKIIKDATQFIKKEAGEKARDDLTDSILEQDPNTFNQEVARISAYIILQKTLPDLCENKYLSKPRAEYLEIVQEGLKQQKLADTSIAIEEVHLSLQDQEDTPSSSPSPTVATQLVGNHSRTM